MRRDPLDLIKQVAGAEDREAVFFGQLANELPELEDASRVQPVDPDNLEYLSNLRLRQARESPPRLEVFVALRVRVQRRSLDQGTDAPVLRRASLRQGLAKELDVSGIARMSPSNVRMVVVLPGAVGPKKRVDAADRLIEVEVVDSQHWPEAVRQLVVL